MGYTDVEYKFKKIGKNVEIGKNVYFRYPEEIEIGDNVIIDEFCYFTTKMKIGNNIHIAPFCSVIGGKKAELVMGDYSALASGVRIICGSDDFINGPFMVSTIPIEFRPNCKIGQIILEKHVVVGTNSIILPNCILKEGSGTGAGTLVHRNLKSWSLYLGNPCKKVIERNRENILKGEEEYLEYLATKKEREN
ncbi:acyltransferase [Fusobacterium ulcerans]|uniref:acyltransferase n=1 Tax=Fusobacterium ulcerans TaxID=861 RepID=UPI001D0A5C8D|nr:hypothetical protein [Fusobacterium ulcerans]MCB8566633.1 hypothetical protein [Fusobacterium ulcerans]MCB8650873.1 hypothetical protein [Fusobacterium ulcerans]